MGQDDTIVAATLLLGAFTPIVYFIAVYDDVYPNARGSGSSVHVITRFCNFQGFKRAVHTAPFYGTNHHKQHLTCVVAQGGLEYRRLVLCIPDRTLPL